MNRWALPVLAILLLAPVSAQDTQESLLLLEDAAGDVQVKVYDQAAPMPGAWGPVDLRSLMFTEDRDFVHVTVGIDSWPDCAAGTCANSGDLRTHLSYNGAEYVIQQGLDLIGTPYAFIYSQFGNSFQISRLGQLEVTREPDMIALTAHVPRDMLLDPNGTPPRTGATFTDIHTYSYSQASFGFIDPENPTGPARDAVVTQDTMGEDAPASFPIALGGTRASGPIELDSPAPFRASNGGAATYRFELEATYRGDGERFFDLEFENVPESWVIEQPSGVLKLEANAPATFSILVSTPFGHQHGGSDTFTFRIRALDDASTWAETDLGIHHLTTPQPSGHHPTLFFHSRAIAPPFDPALGAIGAVSGQLFTNTLQEDPGDQRVETQGWSNLPGQDRFRFAACLEPGLLMGIDVNMTMEGLFDASFTSTIPLDDVVITGRILHLAPGEALDNCIHSQYQGREETILSTFATAEPFSVAGTTAVQLPVLPHEDGDYIEYDDGAMLVIEFEVSPETLPNDVGPNGPLSLRLLPGGSITLPLDEYTDARPSGLIGLGEAPTSSTDDDAFEGPTGAKESPMGLLPLLGVAAVALARRRS